MIPAGLRPGETEFFELDNNLMAMHHGALLTYRSLPTHVHLVVANSINVIANTALDEMGITDAMERHIQFLRCNCGNYDFTPDIAPGSNRLQLEYVKCSLRGGSCSYEGKLCQPVHIGGRRLTMTELRVISCIRAGMQDKAICAELGIEIDTLRTHKRNIQPKLGAISKVHIATQAFIYGIL
jgi:DNA-binding CsgD family transcriptional regulator